MRRFFRKLWAGDSREPQAPASKPFDVFIFPIVDWEYRFQRPQHLALELVRRGYRVFYFSTTFLPDVCDFDPEPRRRDPHVFELPGTEDPPDIYGDVPTEAQLTAMHVGIRRIREKFGVEAVLAVVDYPFWLPLVKRLSNAAIVYDCMDDYGSFPNAGPPLQFEPEMFQRSDLVICSSEHLRDRARRFGCSDPALVRNGVDTEHYHPPPERLALEADGRTVGYHGAISTWTDVALIEYAARSLPEKRFVVVGQPEVDVSAIAGLPNVVLTGEVPYPDLPGYLHAFDVGIVPYRICDYSLASDPMKVWEYLAAGKPVVSVRFPEVERLGEMITLADGREEFVAGIRAAFGKRSAGEAARRREFVREHSWTARADLMLETVKPLFPKISVVVLCHNQVEFTTKTLDSIAKFTRYPNLELIVVDNASTDGTVEMLASRKDVRVIRNGTNTGFAAGNNAGLRAASGEYLAMVNNDVFVTEGWAGDMLAHFRRNPKLGLLGPVTNASGNESVIDIEYGDMETMAVRARAYTGRHRRQLTYPGVLHFFCVMLPRRVWEEVGELDEGFGLGMFEDDDYTIRVRRAGYEAACAEDVFVHHHHSASFGALPKEEYESLFEKNRRYFESKWGRWTAPVFRAEVQEKCSR